MAFRTTMIIGATARIGIVWLAITQGISDRSMARLWTMPMAKRMPSTAPMPKPSSVAESVIHA
ncbi:hypothetical protein D3C78_1831800 [compost metagenome]